MQRLVKKMGLPGLLIGVGAMLSLVATALILAVGYHDQLNETRHTLYDRCQAGVARAEALAVALDALDGYYADLQDNLTANPSPQADAFNARLAMHVAEVRQKISAAVDLAVPPPCDVYR